MRIVASTKIYIFRPYPIQNIFPTAVKCCCSGYTISPSFLYMINYCWTCSNTGYAWQCRWAL